MSHIGTTDTASIIREEYTTHGHHLSSMGKIRLIHVTTESICGGHVPCMSSSIPIIIQTSLSFTTESICGGHVPCMSSSIPIIIQTSLSFP
jgi:hypothetical protein